MSQEIKNKKTKPIFTTNVKIEYNLKQKFEVLNSSNTPDIWQIKDIDWDNNSGSIGFFKSYQEILDNLDDIAKLSNDLYVGDYARRGQTPEYTLVDGRLIVDFNPIKDNLIQNLAIAKTVTTSNRTMKLPYNFYLSIDYTSEKPNEWTISYIDYDGACGAYGIFDSEQTALENVEKFLKIAIDLYDKKYAKYGQTPVVKLVDGKLETDLYPNEENFDKGDFSTDSDEFNY